MSANAVRPAKPGLPPRPVEANPVFRILAMVLLILWAGLIGFISVAKYSSFRFGGFLLLFAPNLLVAVFSVRCTISPERAKRLWVCAAAVGQAFVALMLVSRVVIQMIEQSSTYGSPGDASSVIFLTLAGLIIGGLGTASWLGVRAELAAMGSGAAATAPTGWGESGAAASAPASPAPRREPQARTAHPAVPWVLVGVACLPLVVWIWVSTQAGEYVPAVSHWAVYLGYPAAVGAYAVAKRRSAPVPALAAVALGALMSLGIYCGFLSFSVLFSTVLMFAMQGFGSGSFNEMWVPAVIGFAAQLCALGAGSALLTDGRRLAAAAPAVPHRKGAEPEDLPETDGSWDQAHRP